MIWLRNCHPVPCLQRPSITPWANGINSASFLPDPIVPHDNNKCENAIRPFVVGRKSWLFCDTQAGATASARLYSLVETAKANRVEPHAYLTYLFTHLPTATTVDEFEALLPWNVKIDSSTKARASP